MAQTEHFPISIQTQLRPLLYISDESKSTKVKAVMQLEKAQMNSPKNFTKTHSE